LTQFLKTSPISTEPMPFSARQHIGSLGK